MKTRHLFLLILITLTTTASSAGAQAYRSQLRFLEEFAVRQYDRGDKEGAAKQFGWILRIDPENPTANEYIKKITDQPAVTGKPIPERMTQIISDISSVKNDVVAYEKQTQELEGLIRGLITENDALYQALYKRSREVVELREKFYGTPYEQAYVEVMKTLPIDRVPQRLHRPNEILPDETLASVKKDEQEIDSTLKDISELNAKQKSIAQTKDQETSPELEQLKAVLQEKRAILIEKTMTLTEKLSSLDQLKNELTSINTGLKQTNNRYVEALAKIDAYYIRIKDQLAKKNFVEQKMFSELVADYGLKLKEIEELKKSARTRDDALTASKPAVSSASQGAGKIDMETLLKIDAHYMRIKDDLAKKNYAEQKRFSELVTDYGLKLKEIEELKKSSRTRDDSLTSFKPQISSANKRLEDIDKEMADKNKELAQFKALLARYKSDLSLTDEKLTDMDNQVTSIEAQLKAGDAQLAQLKANIARYRGPLSRKQPATPVAPPAPPLPVLSETQGLQIKSLEAAAANIKVLETQLNTISADLKKPLLVNDPEKQAQREAIYTLKNAAQKAQESAELTRTTMNELALRHQKLLAKVKNYDAIVSQNNTLQQNMKMLQDQSALLATATDKIKTLEKNLAGMREGAVQKVSLQNENSQLRQTILDMTEKVTGRSKELASAAQNLETLKNSIKTKDTRLAELSERVATMQQEQRSLRPILSGKTAQDRNAIQELEQRLRHTAAKLTSVETQLTRAQTDAAAMQEQLLARDEQIAKLQSAPAIQGNAEKKVLMDAIVSKDEELTEIKEKLKTFEDNTDAAIADAVAAKEQTLIELQQRSSEQEAKIQAMAQTHDQLRAELTALKAQPTVVVEKSVAADPQELRQLTLDLSEKEALISKFREDLQAAGETVKAAEDKMQAAEMKYATLTIKQEAIDQIMNDREMTIARLNTELQAFKDELAAVKKTYQQDLVKAEEAGAAKLLAEKKLQSNEGQVAQLQDTVKDLVSDIRSAKALADKKNRDHDATLKELRRLSDILDQKKEELNALQRRVDAGVKKPQPVAATTEAAKVIAPDCFKDCVQK